MNNITIGAAGLFSIDVYDEQGRRVDHRPMQPNLVTDAGLEAMLLALGVGQVRVGGGSTEPAAADVTLAAPLPDMTYTQGELVEGGTLYYKENADYAHLWTRAAYQAKNTGTAVVNIKELGLWCKDLGKMATHALINGSPITLQPNWWVVVTYERRAYYPLKIPVQDVEMTIAGEKKTYHVRQRMVTRSNGKTYTSYLPQNYYDGQGRRDAAIYAYQGQDTLGNDIKVEPSGSMRVLYASPPTQATLSGSKCHIDYKIEVGTDEWNDTRGHFNIMGIYYGGLCSHLFEFKDDAGKGIPKDQYSTLTMTFRYSVSRWTGALEERE